MNEKTKNIESSGEGVGHVTLCKPVEGGMTEQEKAEAVTSSGNDVPIATIVRPIISSLILRRRARADAPSVSQSAPKMTSRIPAMKHNMESIISFYLEFLIFCFLS